uniref:Uncharacterized protein n=1 Tax=Anabas testudineus TaxID=64144 RepID=A0A3Q1HBA8_ANATE
RKSMRYLVLAHHIILSSLLFLVDECLKDFLSPDGIVVGRLCSQERTLAVLLEQAFKIKDEVAAGLQSTQGSVQVQKLSHKLLENHILTITRIVKQLSMDIQALERQIAQRDSVTSGTTLAIQSLDHKNMAGIGDLRGRVARYAPTSVKRKQCNADKRLDQCMFITQTQDMVEASYFM